MSQTTVAGSFITVNTIDSDHYMDGSIDTVHIGANQIDGTKIAIASQAAGDIMYYNGTDWVRVGVGTDGQVLTVNNAENAPGWEAAAGGPTEATKANMEAEATGTIYAPPDLVKNSPGVAKAWCQIAANASLSSPSYNVDSVTTAGTGQRSIVWDTDFSSTVYAMVAEVNDTASKNGMGFYTFATGSVTLNVRVLDAGNDNTYSLVNGAVGVAAYGDQ